MQNIAPDSPLAAAAVHYRAGRFASVAPLLEAHLAASPGEHAIWFTLGEVRYRLRQFAGAVTAYREALRLAPDRPEYFADLGVALKSDQRPAEAEAILREAMRRAPDNTSSAMALAGLLNSQRRRSEAETVYRTLLAADPLMAGAVENFGALLMDLGRLDEAVSLIETYLVRRPKDVRLVSLLSMVLDRGNNLDAALAVADRALAVAPPSGLDPRLASYMSLVGRTGRLDLRGRVLDLLAKAIPLSLPDDNREAWFKCDRQALWRFAYLFPYYGVEDRSLLKVHRALGEQIAASRKPLLPPQPAKQEPGRLRIGFLSPNFGDHPIGHLLAPFFETHGHSRTEVFLYATHIYAKDVSGYGDRIRATPDHFRDCRNKSDAELDAIIRADRLHVLIDLVGYLAGGRPEVLALRPAPVQIHWLQSLAGMPAPFIDYTIVDRVIVPDDERDNGNGPLIRLADAFQCGEMLALPERPPTRAALGLPEAGFVFCAFGNWLKIDGQAFAAWMQILAAVQGSVLWLSKGPTPGAIAAMRQSAKAAGIDPARLILGQRTDDKLSHIDRHRAADLFLDTFTFSAATTTTDALSAGLPVLTKRGRTAQARLSESLIRAVGPSELVVETAEDFVATAIRLARDPGELAHHRAALAQALPTSRLFDAGRMVRQFEQIYETVWRRHVAGEAPGHFDVVL